MKSIRHIDRRFASVGASITLLLGILVPSVLPMAASAATLQSRSVEASSAAASDTNVNYTISFTTISAAEGFVVDFCTDSPFENDTCTPPTGLDVHASGFAVTSTTGSIGTISTTGSSANHLVIQGSAAQSSAGAIAFQVTKVANPTSTGVIYARIYSYAGTIDYTDATHAGTVLDYGGAAMDFTTAIGVTAAVREKLIFCVSHDAPGPTCGTSGQAVTAPSLVLGQGSVGSQALDSGSVSTGDDYSQISTNAVNGAVVNILNSNQCGGLHRAGAGASVCDIAPAGVTATTIAAGDALFGVKVGTPTGSSGTAAPDAKYADASKYGMGWVNGNATGVSSPYGDKLYDTAGTVANNVNVPMTFAASISNDTPAGLYSATINLIATGTF